MYKYLFVAVLLCLNGITSVFSQSLEITRLNNNQPIITPEMFKQAGADSKDGENINGPCLISLPDWLDRSKRINPKANYYLYFGHHGGLYIRLAWAENILGPWTLYKVNADLKPWEKGVLSIYMPGSSEKKIDFGNNLLIDGHISSPIVIIDNENKNFRLYFHGHARWEGKRFGQKTFVSTSSDGLDFNKNIRPVTLGPSYFAPFEYDNHWYTFTKNDLFVSPEKGELGVLTQGYQYPKDLWKGYRGYFDDFLKVYAAENNLSVPIKIRHMHCHREGNMLHILFSTTVDTPERIYYTKIILSKKGISDWKHEKISLVFSARENWEGASLPPELSVSGPAKKPLNEVRDPYIFKDKNNSFYMIYCAGGEQALGIASISGIKTEK